MAFISQRARYAILAMGCLARCSGDWHRAPEISDCINVPLDSLRKILSLLERAGLLRSKRGYKGGYRLTSPAEEITLATIVAAVDPVALEPRCFFGLELCTDERFCLAHDFWEETRDSVHRFLRETTLANVAEFDWSTEILGNPAQQVVTIGKG